MFKKTLLAGMITILANGLICQAATPTDIGEIYKRDKELYQEKVMPDKNNIINNTQEEVVGNQPDDVYITVSKINTDKSAILTIQEIRAITAKYEGRELSLKDLNQVVNEINTLYKTKHYITAKAILPPQKIVDGEVRIQLVEGRFGNFLLEGNKHTKNSFITERLSLQHGDLVNLEQLQKDLYYLNNTSDIRMQAELRPGQTVGTTDSLLKIREPALWQASLFVDNAGRSESGLYRSGLTMSNNSLFGNRETLVLSPTWTKGTTAGSVSYSIPVTNTGMRFGVSYSKNQMNIISGSMASMDIVGNYYDLGLNLTWPEMITDRRKVEGYAEVHRKDSSTDFFGNNLLKSKIYTGTIGSNILVSDKKGQWNIQYSVTQVEASQKDGYTGKDFSHFNFSTTRQEIIDQSRMLIFRASGQLTGDRELPSTEQFSIGGMSSVKGFKEGLASGDQGLYAGIEYDFPTLCRKMKGLLFVDYGYVYNKYDTGLRSKDFLTSAGFGVTINYSADVYGKIVVGFPVDSSKPHDKSQLHFFLQSNFK